MAKILVVGGGLAGLSASVFLSKNGYQVELIESSPKLGGRAYSFFDEETQTEIDNGQHILIGAYKNTLEFLKLVNSIHLLEYQKNLKIVFYLKDKQRYELNASKYFYPFNLLNAIWNFDALSKIEKFRFIKFVISLLFVDDNKIKKLSIIDWLKLNRQSENSIKSFWEILAIGAINSDLDEASALLFKRMLMKIFFGGNVSSTIILPNAGLSKIFSEPAINFLKSYNFSYSVSEKVEEINLDNNRVFEIKTNKRVTSEFDFIVLAIQPFKISKINSNSELFNTNFNLEETSSILSINIWLRNNTFQEKFFVLIDSKIHWIFNHDKYITLIISAANIFNDLSKAEIVKNCITELKKYFPNFDENSIERIKIIKEKKATLKSTPVFENFRESLEMNFSNLFFIGDWTNTKLPQTIESAITSGKEISKKIVKKNQK
jgi:hydroxysqualene dehydroxylase